MKRPITKIQRCNLWATLTLAMVMLIISANWVAAAEVIERDVDGSAGAEQITIDGSQIAIKHLDTGKVNTYSIGGTIMPGSLKFGNLDHADGTEIIGLSSIDSSKNKVFIINEYNNLHYCSDSSRACHIKAQWDTGTLDIPASVNEIEVKAKYSTPAATSGITTYNFGNANTTHIVIPGRNDLYIVDYGLISASSYGVNTNTYSGKAPEEYLIKNMDNSNEEELVGLYTPVSGVRSIFILNPVTHAQKTYSPGQGIISPHLIVPPYTNHYLTNNVIVTNLDGNGLELVGLYLVSGNNLGLFRISYGAADGYGYENVSNGVYLGPNSRLLDARYVLADIGTPNGYEIYGYYGGASINGGFVAKSNLTTISYYTLTNFFALDSSKVGQTSSYLVDQDKDGVIDSQDACPNSAGSVDSDKDGICTPEDKCDSNANLTALNACGTCISGDKDCDKVADASDACPNDASGSVDSDADGVCDGKDKCPTVYGWQNNDNDGSCAPQDECDSDPNKTKAGLCGCGVVDPVTDRNGDGYIGPGDCNVTSCPGDPTKPTGPGKCGCGVPDIDSDGDGTYDCNDECSFDSAKKVVGICGCFSSDVDVNGNGIIDCLEMPSGSLAYYYHSDPTGTPEAISDSTGKSVWTATYMPFGEEYVYTGSIYNDRRFIAKEKDIESGLTYFGARYMDVGIGRFLAPDPVRVVDPVSGDINTEILSEPQRSNLYIYSLNDPFNMVDPNGESGIEIELDPFTGLPFFKRTAAIGYEDEFEQGLRDRDLRWGSLGRISASKSAAKTLPQMKGRSVSQSEKTLQEHGFTKTKVSNNSAKNQIWQHADGSEVRIHPYGNQNTAPYRSANNAHVHKQNPDGNQLTDRGVANTDPTQTHIGIKNPKDLPTVRGRAHGAGTQ